ncbi:uncharacterized protein LOC111321599 [Stylophora pistillata]|nr:uncharacterized protein LOC111321599 [Stylophora pistillata]
MLLEFSDSTLEKITLKENRSDFEEFFFTSRRASWVKFTITEVNCGSGGVGIQEIEIYDEKCDHKTFCDTIQLSDHSRSSHYRLQSNQFPLMIEAEDDVLVLLTSDSRGDDYHYKIEIGSNGSIALSNKTNECEQRFKSNVTLLKANETRLFWLDIQTDRLVFGSGEQIYLFWREAKPIKIKYAVFNTTTSPASFQICPLMGVVKRLNITVKSESSQTPDRNLPNGVAFIWVNNENYAPQSKGYNVAVFDALTGRVLTSAAFDCAESQKECDKLGTFLKDLPQDVIVLLAVQDSAVGSYTLPTSDLIGIGAQKARRVVGQTSHAVIGYKGWRGVTWIKEDFKQNGEEPAEVSSSIPISFLYLPEDSTACTPFNVASQKYGGSCLNQSSSNGASNGCEKVLDESTAFGWESSTNESVNSFLEIGFHSTFTINKLRIMQKTTPGRRIHKILLEFSDHSLEDITLAENSLDFEEFTFFFRKADWVKFTIMEVYNGSGGVGIQEIEFYNGMCKQNTICDVLQLQSDSKSVPYRLHSTRFPLMINSRDNVSVLLTTTSRVNSPLYNIEIVANGDIILKINDDEIKQVMRSNVTLLKENETRLFWVEMLTDQLVFGSGEKIYLFWRDAKPIKTKYASFSTTSSSAVIHVCARLDHCYKDTAHYWPLDKSVVYQQDVKGDGSLVGKIHGPWTIHHIPANLNFTPLALSLSGSHSWVDLRSVEKSEQSCIFSPSHCNNGISLSFKAYLSTNGIGYILSSGGKNSNGFSIYHDDGVMHFNVRDGQNIWQVQGSYESNAWHTFAMSWSHADGLTAVIGGDSTSVLRDTGGKTVTLTQASHSSLIIGRSTNMDGGVHAEIVLRDVAIWEEAIAQERMSALFVCNDLESCNPGWQYFDGSCYKVMVEQLDFSTALESCRNGGGELVKISSEEENNYVKAIANNAQPWIGLEKKTADGSFSWTDGSGLFFNELDGSEDANHYCVRMKDDGKWTVTSCSSTHISICEQIPWNYLGCYEDSTFSPRFVFNPGDYRGSRITTGLCMHSCGTLNFTYAALRGGNICLCSNSTANVTERPRDLCLSACLGAGNLKCGGGSYLSVYKSVQVQPLNLELSSDSSAVVLKAFNLKMKPSLSEDQIVESFEIIVGDGVEFLNHNETKSEATLLFIHPGNYTVRVKANVKHTKTGHHLAVESSMTELAVSNITDIEFICPAVCPVKFTFSCSLQFHQGRNVNATIEFEEVEYNSGFIPDAMIMTAGVIVSDPGGQDTSDGLYLLPTTDVTNKGKAVAFKMEVSRGGFLEIKVYRPKCLDSKQRYCRAKRMCVSSVLYSNVCPAGETDNTVGNKKFSFAGAQCVKEDGSFSENNTTAQANFDYENISSCMIQTTSGHKVVLVESCTLRLEVDEGDVIAVQFPSSKPAAAIETSLSSISLFYNESLSNGTEVLRSNRRPATASSPTELHHAPMIAILYTALSGRSFDHVYQTYGNKSVSLTVENSHRKVNYTAQIVVQEPIKGLELSLPDVFALEESVNVTTNVTSGTDITYYWQFSDGVHNTTVSPFVTRVFKKIGEVDIFVYATNDVSSAAVRCSVDVQERIDGFKFRNNSLLPVEYGKTVSIFWLLRKGSHVNFNFSITSKKDRYFRNAKTVNTILFSIYKTNFSIPDLYFITIVAANKVNNLTLSGNLSVEQNLTSIEMNFTRLVKTNHSFDFIMLPHQGNRTAIYTLNITRETDPTKTTRSRTSSVDRKYSVVLGAENDQISRFPNDSNITITYEFSNAGKYSVALSAVNDISSLAQNYPNITVQDEIKDFSFDDYNTEIIIQISSDRVNISWSLAKGTNVSIVVDYGDGNKTHPWVIPNEDKHPNTKYRNTTTYDYKEAGKYTISFKAKNLVSEKQLNKAVYVDPYELYFRCVQCREEGSESVANPSSKLTFKGYGKARGGKPINFNWKVKNCSKDGKDCAVPMDLKDFNSTPLDWKYLVIKPDKLQGGIRYKIILVGQVGDHEKQKTKQLRVRANIAPSKGNCTITPTEGQALKTLFNLTCNGFNDSDRPLRYEFLYSKSPKDLNQSLGSGLDPWQNNVVLPSGENITIYAKV